MRTTEVEVLPRLRPKTATDGIGEIIGGTCRAADLIPEFLDFLAECGEAGAREAERIREEIDEETSADGDASWEDCIDGLEDPEGMLDEILELIDAHADLPPFCRFGASEGDGASWGVWFDNDVWERERQDPDQVLGVDGLEKVSPLMLAEHPDALVAVVNDHGNLTLYRQEIALRPVLDIV